MLDVFESNLIRDGLLKKGDRLVLGVSGGPDSMAMLDMFLKIRERWHLGLFVVHVNHGLEGTLPVVMPSLSRLIAMIRELNFTGLITMSWTFRKMGHVL